MEYTKDSPILEIKKVGIFKDFSATIYSDRRGNLYFKDTRLSSKTYGWILNKYPTDEGAEIPEFGFHIVNRLFD